MLPKIWLKQEPPVPVNCKRNTAGYLVSSYFKDLYLYLAQSKLPSTKAAIHKVEC